MCSNCSKKYSQNWQENTFNRVLFLACNCTKSRTPFFCDFVFFFLFFKWLFCKRSYGQLPLDVEKNCPHNWLMYKHKLKVSSLVLRRKELRCSMQFSRLAVTECFQKFFRKFIVGAGVRILFWTPQLMLEILFIYSICKA